ncbi:PDR/VanB family oxidoreductase [Amorphus sp. MBR-141]
MYDRAVDVQVIAVRTAAQNTNLYDIAASEGPPLPATTPGAHVDLHLPNGMVRQYSLVSARAEGGIYTLGIKLDPKSRGGSSYIHEHLSAGDALRVGPLRNNFPLTINAAFSVFIAGGIGITPLWAMIEELKVLGAAWRLYYSCRTRNEALFLDRMQHDDRVVLNFDDENGGRYLDIAAITGSAPAGTHFYCCGPTLMLKALEIAVSNVPPAQVHLEYFSATQSTANAGGFKVVLARSGAEFNVAAGQTILEALREQGFDVTTSCEQGLCGMCETPVLEGEPDHRDEVMTDVEKAAGDRMMICCSGSRSARLVLDI